jgi:glycosyltransferase involved in cell wall biosynthesis
LIVGDGPLSASLKLQVSAGGGSAFGGKSLTLENNVIFHGFAKDSSEIAELMNKSKILVMPSYNEGGPRVVLEAMACGVPVFATNVGLMPDFAGKNAVKIIDWNAEDIASKAKELLENEDELNRLSQAGVEVSKQFEKKAATKNYADKLKEFVKT